MAVSRYDSAGSKDDLFNQDTLFELADWANTVRDRSVLDSCYVELRIERRTLQIRLLSHLQTAVDVITYTELGKRLCDQVNHALMKAGSV